MPEIAMCLGSIFTPGVSELSTNLIGKLLEELSDLNSPPIAMPIPENMPKEIPRVLLKSGDGSIEARLAPARSDIIWRRSTPETKPMPDLAQIVSSYLVRIHLIINNPLARFGFIANHFLEADDPSSYLANSFASESARERILHPIQQFEIHWLLHEILDEFGTVNHWVRLRSATINRGSDSEDAPVISIENDVNTVVSEIPSNFFEHSQIPGFFSAAADRIESQLNVIPSS